MAQISARFRHVAESQHHGRDSDRDVDEEVPAPGDEVGEDATEQQPEGRAAGGDRRPDAQRASALALVLERGHDDRERGGGHQCAAKALEATAEDQHRRRLRHAVEQRGACEQHNASDEEAPAPEQVGRAPTEHQEAAEDERVAIHDPLQVRGREVQATLDARQRDVHDRRVEHDHELRQAGDHKDQPAIRR